MPFLRLLAACGSGASGNRTAPSDSARAPADSAAPADSTVPVPVDSAARAAADGAAETYVERGACPFECCTYGDWRAREAIPVFRAERDTSAVAFTLAKGERFRGVTGNVHLEPVGLALATDTLTLHGDDPSPVPLRAGDTVRVLSYQGEGHYTLSFRGRTLTHPAFWEAAQGLPVRSRLLRAPGPRWWARVRTADGRGGWIDMDASAGKVAGVDACGGPD